MDLFLVLSAALTLAGANFDNVDNSTSLQSIIADCLNSNNTVTCLSIKGITALNRAAQNVKKFEILPGVSIRRYERSFLHFYLFTECFCVHLTATNHKMYMVKIMWIIVSLVRLFPEIKWILWTKSFLKLARHFISTYWTINKLKRLK